MSGFWKLPFHGSLNKFEVSLAPIQWFPHISLSILHIRCRPLWNLRNIIITWNASVESYDNAVVELCPTNKFLTGIIL
jgi:hypothetical protein